MLKFYNYCNALLTSSVKFKPLILIIQYSALRSSDLHLFFCLEILLVILFNYVYNYVNSC